MKPLSCDFDPVGLAVLESFTLLMKVDLHTSFLKFMELLTILRAKEELW